MNLDEMCRWLALLSMLLGILAAAPPTEGAVRPPAHTKKQAEVNVLRLVAKSWKAWRRSGVVNPRTHLLADNTEAVCSGRGRSWAQRYERFLCVVGDTDGADVAFDSDPFMLAGEVQTHHQAPCLR